MSRKRESWNTGCAKSALTALMISTAAVSTASAAEIELRGAHIFPESFIQSGVNFEEWAKRVEEASGGRITTNIIHGGALLSLADHVDGIEAGLVDVTSFYPIYFPGEFQIEGALTNIIDIWSEEVPDLEGVALIHAQLHDEFEEFQTEYQRRNMHMLLPLPADPYVISCTEEVKSVEDLAGRKMRTFGRYFPILQENLGVQPVTVPGPEAYSALATGLVDCVYSTPDWIYANSLHEVAPHIFIPAPEKARPQLFATSVVAMNTDSYEALPDDLQQIVDEVSAEMTGYIGQSMAEVYDQAIKNLMAEGKGATINYMTEEEMAAWAERTPNQLDQAAKDLDAAGYPGDEIINRYRELSAAYVAGEWPEEGAAASEQPAAEAGEEPAAAAEEEAEEPAAESTKE